MEKKKHRFGSARSPVLLVVGVMAGSLLVSPAVAHVTRSLKHLTKHLDPAYLNVGEAYGKSETDAKFLDTGEAYTKGQADAAFINADEGAAARVYKTTDFAVPSATFLPVPFDGEVYDTDNLHSLTGDTTRLTAPVTGVYAISGHVNWASSATGDRWLLLQVNGGPDLAVEIRDAAASDFGLGTGMTASTVARLSAGDYLQLEVYQNSGTSQNVLAGGMTTPFSPVLSMAWIGPA